MSDLCQCCGKAEERTSVLAMSCNYGTTELELGLPFPVGRNDIDSRRVYYAVDVCNACRLSWLNAMKTWFARRGKTDTSEHWRDLGAYIEAIEAEMEKVQNRNKERP